MLGKPIDENEEEPALFMAPVRGFRAWSIEKRYGDLRLVSPQQKITWMPKLPLEATCQKCVDKKDSKCHCGINAFKTEDAVNPLEISLLGGIDAWGSVNLWGDVTEYETGYRGRYAYPEKITINADKFSEEDAKNIAESYGVEVMLEKYSATGIPKSVGQIHNDPSIPKTILWLVGSSLVFLCLSLFNAKVDAVGSYKAQIEILKAWNEGKQNLGPASTEAQGVLSILSLVPFMLMAYIIGIKSLELVRGMFNFLLRKKLLMLLPLVTVVIMGSTFLLMIEGSVRIKEYTGLSQAQRSSFSEDKLLATQLQTSSLILSTYSTGAYRVKEGKTVSINNEDNIVECALDEDKCQDKKFTSLDMVQLAFAFDIAGKEKCNTLDLTETFDAEQLLSYTRKLSSKERDLVLSTQGVKICRDKKDITFQSINDKQVVVALKGEAAL